MRTPAAFRCPSCNRLTEVQGRFRERCQKKDWRTQHQCTGRLIPLFEGVSKEEIEAIAEQIVVNYYGTPRIYGAELRNMIKHELRRALGGE